MVNPYKVLGVEPGASKEEIKKSFNGKVRIAYINWVTDKSKTNKQYLDAILDSYIFLHDIYDYANLDIPDAAERNTVCSQYLEARKLTMYRILENYYNLVKMAKRKYSKPFIKNYIKGFLWICGGIIISLASYIASRDTGSSVYFVFYGAVIYGIYIVLKTGIVQSDFEESVNYEVMLWTDLE